MRIPGTPVVKAPKKAANVDLWYDRPAGAFPASMVVEDGAYAGLLYAPYIAVKPYVKRSRCGLPFLDRVKAAWTSLGTGVRRPMTCLYSM